MYFDGLHGVIRCHFRLAIERSRTHSFYGTSFNSSFHISAEKLFRHVPKTALSRLFPEIKLR